MTRKLSEVCVITLDLKASRKISERIVIQREIKELLKALNRQYTPELLAEFMITLGDEFQGVLKTPAKVYDIFLAIHDQLHLPFYCGIGVGSIETELSRKVIEMDGPAFHRSREALEEAKKIDKELVVNSGNDTLDQILNALLALLSVIRSKWTKKQREIVAYLGGRPEIPQVEVARKFGVTKQSISKTLASAHWKTVETAEQVVRRLLQTRVASEAYTSQPEKAYRRKSTIRG